MLARHINRSARCTRVPVGRRHIDDAPASLRQHHPQLMLHAQQHAEHIGVEGRGIAFSGLLRNGTRLAFGTGAVHRHVQSAKLLHGLVDWLPSHPPRGAH